VAEEQVKYLDHTLNVIIAINFFASVMTPGAAIASSAQHPRYGNRQSRCHILSFESLGPSIATANAGRQQLYGGVFRSKFFGDHTIRVGTIADASLFIHGSLQVLQFLSCSCNYTARNIRNGRQRLIAI
jgi:hypothetical protein